MQANEIDPDVAPNDLGPLAWVLDELRKSLDSASSALRRFVRDTGLARGSDMASVDGGQLSPGVGRPAARLLVADVTP